MADLLFGSPAAKQFILQFGVRLPAGTFGVSFMNAAQTRCYADTYTVAAGEANSDATKSIVLTADTLGTWIKDSSGAGLDIRWSFGCGTSLQGATGVWGASSLHSSAAQLNVMATNGNVVELFDVALYEGNVTQVFEMSDFAETLRNCERLWQSSYAYGTRPGTATNVNQEAAWDNGSTASIIMRNIHWRGKMRAAPTVTMFSPVTGASGVVYNSAGGVDVAATIDSVGDQSARINGTATQSWYGHWVADAGM
ncbi:hypothetical protein [Bradyrhizobium sp. S3.14.4]